MSTAAPPPIAAPTRVDYVALPAGTLIGRYQVASVLGQGGFGITYLARDTQLGRDVAVKEYLPAALAVRPDGSSVLPRSTEVADDFGWGRSRFIEEGRTLANLHEAPSIVKVFDFLEANGTAYIVMELLRGRTLESQVKAEGPLAPAGLQAMLSPLLAGLQKVHDTGFLHRDIKPANIMLGADGSPTLIDFGAARAAMADRTKTMTAIFTPGYAAPEQFTSAKQGPWTDIYGLSATLHYAITGRAPPSAFDRLMEDTYQSLAGSAPQGFDVRLLLGIDSRPVAPLEQRPASIAAWRTLLGDQPADDAPTLVMASPRRSPPAALAASRRSTARRGWLALGAGLVLAAAAGAYVTFAPALTPQVEPTASHIGRSDAAAVRGSGGSRVDSLDRGPSAHTARADGAGLRHARHGWHLRSALARDDRGLAAGAEASGDGLPDRGRKPGAARRQPAAAIGGRPAGCSDGRRRLLRGFAVGVGDGRRGRSAGAHGSGSAPCRPPAHRPDRSSDLRQPAGFSDGRFCRHGQRQPAPARGGGLHEQHRFGERPCGGQHADARSAWRRRQVPRHAVVAARAVAGKSGAAFGHAHRHALIEPYFGVIAMTATLLLIAVTESPGLTRGSCARPSAVLTL